MIENVQDRERTEVTVPVRFYDDHCDRELPAGTVIKRTKNKVTVSMTHEEIEELRSDADYYESEAKYMGREFVGLGRSAAATVKAIDKVYEEMTK